MDPDKLAQLSKTLQSSSALDPWNIFFSVMFGLVGFAYIAYGKKSTSFPFMFCGLSLMVYTFFVTTTSAVLWWGVGLMIAPFLLDRYL